MPRYVSSLYPNDPTPGQQQPTKGRGTVSPTHLIIFILLCKQVTLDSLVGQYVSLKDKVSVKHSMVHSHSTIGEKTRLLLSVVMDHVKIGDK